jgi:phage-related protein
VPITAQRLQVDVQANTGAATKAMGDLEREGSKIPGWAKAAGAALAGAFAVSKITDGVKRVIDAASNVQQSFGGVDAVFQGSAKQVHAWAQSAASDVGLSEDSYNSLASVIGTQLKSAGLSLDEAANKTNGLIGLSSDLAATFGGSTADAAGALGAALRGEFDPAEKFGLALSMNAVQAQAAQMGFKKVNGTLSTHDQRLATLALIYKQTGDAQGQFAAQTNTLAEQQQILSAKATNLAAQLGSVLLPAATQVTSWASDAVGWFADRLPGAIDRTQQVVGALGDLFRGDFSASVNTALGVAPDSALVGFLMNLGSVARSAFSEVTGGLHAMVAAFADGGNDVTSSGFAGFLESIGLAARNFLDPLIGAFKSLGPTLGPVIGQVAQAAAAFNPLSLVIHALTPLLPQIGAMLGKVAAVLLNGLGKALAVVVPVLAQVAGAITGALTQAFEALMPAIMQLLPQVAGLVTTLVNALLPVLSALAPILTQVATILIGAVVQAFSGLLPIVSGLVPVVTQVAQVLGQVLLVAVQALGPLLTMLAGVIADLVPALLPVVAAVMQVVQALLPVVSIVGDLIGALLPPLVSLFMALLKPVLDLIAPLVSSLAPILVTIANVISTLLIPILSLLATWFGMTARVLTPVIALIAGGLVTALTTLIRWVVATVAAVVSFVGQAITGFARFAAAVGSSIAAGVKAVVGIKDAIFGAFGNAGAWLVDSGRKIIQGLIDGVKGMAKKVTDAVGGVLKKARDLLPFSPAKKGPFSGHGWTLYSGRAISEALAQGMTDRAAQVAKAAGRVVDAAQVGAGAITLGVVSSPVLGQPGASGGGPAAGGGSPLDAVGVSNGWQGPSSITVVDADGNLIGTMRVQAGKVLTGTVTPLDEGRTTWD